MTLAKEELLGERNNFLEIISFGTQPVDKETKWKSEHQLKKCAINAKLSKETVKLW